MQDVGADNSDQSDSSTSRVDLDILHQKDRIIDFIGEYSFQRVV